MSNEYVFHMSKADQLFYALRNEKVSEYVKNAELGALGAVNNQVWTSVLGGTLHFESSNGECSLRVILEAPQQEVKS